MGYRSYVAGVLLALAFMLGLVAPGNGAQAQQPLPVPEVGSSRPGAYVSAEVTNALLRGGRDERGVQPSLRVIVTFATAKGYRSTGLTPEDVSTAAAQVLAALPQGSYNIVSSYRRIPALSLEIQPDALEALARHPLVRAVNADSVLKLHMTDALGISGADTVHGYGITGSGIRAAIIDSGIDVDHPALSDDLIFQQCFRTENDCPGGSTSSVDQVGHGTHVAGIITGANGVAPDVEFASLKVFTTGDTSDTNILNALDFVIDNTNTGLNLGFDFINMSLGGDNFADPASCDADNDAYLDAFTSLNALGVAIFASTGNDADIAGTGAPGCVTGAIGVGSTGDKTFGPLFFSSCTDNGALDKVSCYSNTTPVQGAGELVDLLAPGCMITSEVPDNTTDENCGTSMATPYALGVGALVAEYLNDESLTMTPAQLEAHLEITGVQITDYRLPVSAPTFPRVSAVNAIGALSIDAPTGFNITGTTTTSISMAWTAVTGAVEYNVYRSVDGASFTLAGTVTHPTVTFTDTNAPCGVVTYYVKADDGTYESLASNSDSDTARTCPLAPTSLTLTSPTADTVSLTWADNATDETAYVVERSVNGGDFVVLHVLGAGVTSDTDGPLACGYYEYRVYAQRGADKSAYSNVVQVAVCAPANDLFQNAEVVPAVIGSPVVDTEANIRYASESASDPTHACRFGGAGAGSNTVWYQLTPAVATLATITTTGTTAGDPPDTIISVYTHNGSAFTEVGCAEDISNANFLSSLRVKLDAGTTYYVQVSQWVKLEFDDPGSLTVNFAFAVDNTPAHDTFANARVINANPYTDTVADAQNATVNALDPLYSCAFLGARLGNHSVWYRFTAPSDGSIDLDTLDSTGSFDDTLLAVYTGTYGALTEVDCNDDGAVNLLSELIDVPVTGGGTYYIHTSHWDAAATTAPGTLVLNFAFTAGPTTELIENGGFETAGTTGALAANWKLNQALNGDKRSCKPAHANDGTCGFMFKGGAAEKTALIQKVDITGVTFATTDEFDFSVDVKSPRATLVFQPSFVVRFSDGTPAVKVITTVNQTTGYETITQTRVGLPSAAVASIKVTLKHKSPANKLFIDNVSLVQTTATPRGNRGAVLPPPAAPDGMRGSN